MSELEHDALQNITPQSERERRLREQLRLAVMSDSEECKLLTTDNERLRAEIERLVEALIWCSAASDFQPGGIAREGWEKLCQPLIVRAVVEGK